MILMRKLLILNILTIILQALNLNASEIDGNEDTYSLEEVEARLAYIENIFSDLRSPYYFWHKGWLGFYIANTTVTTVRASRQTDTRKAYALKIDTLKSSLGLLGIALKKPIGYRAYSILGKDTKKIKNLTKVKTQKQDEQNQLEDGQEQQGQEDMQVPEQEEDIVPNDQEELDADHEREKQLREQLEQAEKLLKLSSIDFKRTFWVTTYLTPLLVNSLAAGFIYKNGTPELAANSFLGGMIVSFLVRWTKPSFPEKAYNRYKQGLFREQISPETVFMVIPTSNGLAFSWQF